MAQEPSGPNLANAFRRLPSAWRKISLAVGGLIVCEIGARIVAPSINGRLLAQYLRRTGESPLLRLYDWIVGGALSRGAVLALGIMPYLSARIIMRLARTSIPLIAEMSEDTADQTRLRRWTRRLTFGLAVVQSFGFARFVQSIPGAVANPGVGFIAQTMLILTTGAMGVAWLSERIAEQRDADPPAEHAPDMMRPLASTDSKPGLPSGQNLDDIPAPSAKARERQGARIEL